MTPYAGVYERASSRIEIEAGETGPLMRTTVTGPLAEQFAQVRLGIVSDEGEDWDAAYAALLAIERRSTGRPFASTRTATWTS